MRERYINSFKKALNNNFKNDGVIYVDCYNRTHNTKNVNCIKTTIDASSNDYIVEYKILSYTRDSKGKTQNKHLINHANTLHSATSSGGNTGQYVVYNDKAIRIRKLTERECFRLMGVDDNNIDKIQAAGISKSRQYKMAGSSIVVDVLENIFRKMFIDTKEEEQQLKLF